VWSTKRGSDAIAICCGCCWRRGHSRRRNLGRGTSRVGGDRECRYQGRSALKPIAGVTWRPYEGSADSLWSAYASARGHRRALLGHLALEPRALFIGSWIASSRIKDVAAEILQDTQQGNSNVLAQFGTFELSPWESAWSGDGQWNVAASERWYQGLTAGLGKARALVIVQIDLPFAARTPNQQPETIDAYGTKTLSADPHTTVYIGAGHTGGCHPPNRARC
jgi:endoglucanase